MDHTAAAKILDAFRDRSVIVLGDFYLDEYLHCNLRGISPEMPVLRMRAERREQAPGAAGNLAANLSRLGALVYAVGSVGADSAGAQLKGLLEGCKVNVECLLEDPNRCTGVLSRILAAGGGGYYHHARIDYEPPRGLSESSSADLLLGLRGCVKRGEALFLADYDENSPRTGVLSPAMARSAISAARDVSLPVYASSRCHPSDFAGADCLICNEREARLVGFSDAEPPAAAAQDIKRRLGVGTLCVTRGGSGVICACDSGAFEKPAYRPAAAREPRDVCGAGDTFGAALLLAALSGAGIEDCLELAGIAAAISVRKAQAGLVSVSEILREMRYPGIVNDKLVSVQELAGLLDDLRPTKKIVFTNGCFDLFHSGHVHLLRSARQFGDVLVVAINSDRSTAENKGAGRPVLSERHRVEILTALDFVDYVTVFDELTPINVIRQIKPHVMVKGGDYTPEEVVGRDIVASYGGEVKIVKYQGQTTSSLIRSIKTASDGTRPT